MEFGRLQFICRVCSAQSLPCEREVAERQRGRRDCAVQYIVFAENQCEVVTFYCGNPSVTPTACQLPLHKGAFVGAAAPMRHTVNDRDINAFPFGEGGTAFAVTEEVR